MRRTVARMGACSCRRYTRSNMNPRSANNRLADLLALHDVAGPRRALDEVVHEGVDPARAGGAEESDLVCGQVALREEPGPDRVVDVVVDVRNAVDDAHVFPSNVLRILVAGVLEDAVPHFPRG